MMKLIARPIRAGEPDLLTGHEREPLFLRDLGGQATLRIAPASAWTHDALDAAVEREDVIAFVGENFGADAFLGGRWIGSSEV
ncbi:hypothetical protein L0Z42_29450 [Burkholderia multivorans]|uniref:hypothetical protein n=1 Tax=Burkholderia cepacia complex TaxID=87882 RepID=UPI00018E3800|nr:MULTISPECIES: hypothetical protein [Burkholderia cepacia complex]EED97255.1 conserved hypothetical protein [Burkholderia multivorans CGD1]MBJ9624977.1 hypothetical protein [Burkholderia multivorans]MCO1374617.1 hypothetical protein [Burkholderia multivorans]MCO1459761.1 hypothetical protein [Burkholderia multivorans]UQO21233.1 hypothetical protein L0Z02_28840 [Burkholderia multivorans]